MHKIIHHLFHFHTCWGNIYIYIYIYIVTFFCVFKINIYYFSFFGFFIQTSQWTWWRPRSRIILWTNLNIDLVNTLVINFFYFLFIYLFKTISLNFCILSYPVHLVLSTFFQFDPLWFYSIHSFHIGFIPSNLVLFGPFYQLCSYSFLLVQSFHKGFIPSYSVHTVLFVSL